MNWRSNHHQYHRRNHNHISENNATGTKQDKTNRWSDNNSHQDSQFRADHDTNWRNHPQEVEGSANHQTKEFDAPYNWKTHHVKKHGNKKQSKLI